jgi:F420-non-reducing hydrogenase iron-sulfur subunit
VALVGRIEPKIVGFLCNWCAYEGADSAGRARTAYPASLNIIKVMCTGRVDPQFVLQSFREGADGVMIMGCHPGDCHYKEGNLQAMRRYVLLRKTLSQMGIEEERLWLGCVSAGNYQEFVLAVNEMVERLRKLFPSHP